MKKLFVAMSHALTQAQIADFRGEVLISKKFTELACSRISAKLSYLEIEAIAAELVAEALEQGCTHFGLNGEPALVFASWAAAKTNGLTVVQSTTERVAIEKIAADGSVTKTSIFNHVQWREI